MPEFMVCDEIPDMVLEEKMASAWGSSKYSSDSTELTSFLYFNYCGKAVEWIICMECLNKWERRSKKDTFIGAYASICGALKRFFIFWCWVMDMLSGEHWTFCMEELRALITFLAWTKCEIPVMLKATAKFPLSSFGPVFCVGAASR